MIEIIVTTKRIINSLLIDIVIYCTNPKIPFVHKIHTINHIQRIRASLSLTLKGKTMVKKSIKQHHCP